MTKYILCEIVFSVKTLGIHPVPHLFQSMTIEYIYAYLFEALTSGMRILKSSKTTTTRMEWLRIVLAHVQGIRTISFIGAGLTKGRAVS